MLMPQAVITAKFLATGDRSNASWTSVVKYLAVVHLSQVHAVIKNEAEGQAEIDGMLKTLEGMARRKVQPNDAKVINSCLARIHEIRSIVHKAAQSQLELRTQKQELQKLLDTNASTNKLSASAKTFASMVAYDEHQAEVARQLVKDSTTPGWCFAWDTDEYNASIKKAAQSFKDSLPRDVADNLSSEEVLPRYATETLEEDKACLEGISKLQDRLAQNYGLD